MILINKYSQNKKFLLLASLIANMPHNLLHNFSEPEVYRLNPLTRQVSEKPSTFRRCSSMPSILRSVYRNTDSESSARDLVRRNAAKFLKKLFTKRGPWALSALPKDEDNLFQQLFEYTN